MTAPRRLSRPSLIPRRPAPRSNQLTNPPPPSTNPLRLSQLSDIPKTTAPRHRLHPATSTSTSYPVTRHDDPQSLAYSSPSNTASFLTTSRRRSGNISSSGSKSRLSFPRLRRGIINQASDASPSTVPLPLAPSPPPSHTPVWDEDSISRTPAKGKENEWLASLGFDLSLLKVCDQSHEMENRDPNLTFPNRRGSSSIRSTSGAKPKSHVKGVRPMWERTAAAFEESCCGDELCTDLLGESEPVVHLCEEEVRVLEACSPVLAELRQVQCAGNECVSSPALGVTSGNRSVSREKCHSWLGCSDEKGMDYRSESGVMSAKRGSRERRRISKRHTDWKIDGELEDREAVVTPGRVRSSRKSLRASARISTRELKALFEGQEGMELRNDDIGYGMGGTLERDVKESEATMGGKRVASASVMLSPVRASRQVRDALGSEKIVTPVRRSLRISRRQLEKVDVDIAEHNSARLESADYAFLPNRNIHERVPVEVKTPLS